MLYLHVCVFGPASVALTPAAKGGGGGGGTQLLCFALYRERIVFSLGYGRETPSCLCGPLSNYHTRLICKISFIFHRVTSLNFLFVYFQSLVKVS